MNIGIVLCTFNGSRFLKEQIDSFPIEDIDLVIVSDDGSVDDTECIVKKCIPVNKCHFRKEKNLGPKSNFFKAITASNLDIVFLSDQDDIWVQDKLTLSCAQLIKENISTPTLLFSNSMLIDANGELLGETLFSSERISEKVLFDDSIMTLNCVQGATVCINSHAVALLRESLKRVDSSRILMHDWWLALLCHYFGTTTFLEKPSIYYRQHSSNVIGSKSSLNKAFSYIQSPIELLRKSKNIIFQYYEFCEFYDCYQGEYQKVRGLTPVRRGDSFVKRVKAFTSLDVKYGNPLRKWILLATVMFLPFK